VSPASEPIRVVPSVLPADFARLGDEVKALEEAGCDRIQWDVMDGHFVPNLTFGPEVIAAARDHTELPFEAHLMVTDPDSLMKKYVEAGCEWVIVHAEAPIHLHRSLSAVAEAGARPGVALNPATPMEAVTHVLDLVDLVLVMTVNPGFGGQDYLSSMEPKIAQARAMIQEAEREIDLEVDGGIGPKTAGPAAKAGARVLVAGSALYKHEGGLKAAVEDVRSQAEAACKEESQN
jgi:ribulose-phosphate 3-epimerase